MVFLKHCVWNLRYQNACSLTESQLQSTAKIEPLKNAAFDLARVSFVRFKNILLMKLQLGLKSAAFELGSLMSSVIFLMPCLATCGEI
jgi:hypothetical protein